jgi:hypothetical protein
MIEGVLCDPQFPFAGLRVLIQELWLGSSKYSWTRLLGQTGVEAAVLRCWAAEGTDRGYAALALSDLWAFAEGGATAVVGPHVTTLANWISNPNDGAFGFGHILNNLAQQDRDIAEKTVAAADPLAIASAYSNANPETAYGLADLLRSVAYVKVDSFNAKVLEALEREKLLELSKHEAFLEHPYVFSKFCASVLWWDENLALEMVEIFVPTAQQVLARDPVEGFHQLDDLASTVLHVFDVLHVYVGKLKPTRRQKMIARRMCAKIDPTRVAESISTVRLRHFQSAAFFLHFLSLSAPRNYEAVLRQLDWEKLDSAIGDDWKDMSHETEVLLGTLYSRPPARHFIQKLISDRADQIVNFPPRLMLMAPEVGLAHLAKGGLLRLAQYDHLSWYFGGVALAIIAEERPVLVEQAVSPFFETVARKVTSYNRSSTGPAEGFVRTVIEHAPVAWREALAKFDPDMAEKNLAECLTKDEDHRRTAAAVIESAIALDSPVGDMARRLRARFPKASVAQPTGRVSANGERGQAKGVKDDALICVASLTLAESLFKIRLYKKIGAG